jgi:hypothetical protein
MGRIANILDLPLEQKFLIVSACLSVEFLSQLAVERGETEEELMEQSLEFVKKQIWSGSEISEEKVNSFLTEHFDSPDFTF